MVAPNRFAQPGYALLWSGQPREVARKIASSHGVSVSDFITARLNRWDKASPAIRDAYFEFMAHCLAADWKPRLLHEQWPSVPYGTWQTRVWRAREQA